MSRRTRDTYVCPVLAGCRTKAAPEITGSYSYVTALRFCCRMLSIACCCSCLLQNALAHIHQSDKLVAFYCLQAANQRRSATMPSCKGARVSELSWPATTKLCSFNFNRVDCKCSVKSDIASRQTYIDLPLPAEYGGT